MIIFVDDAEVVQTRETVTIDAKSKQVVKGKPVGEKFHLTLFAWSLHIWQTSKYPREPHSGCGPHAENSKISKARLGKMTD
jgi:hypothetical protein